MNKIITSAVTAVAVVAGLAGCSASSEGSHGHPFGIGSQPDSALLEGAHTCHVADNMYIDYDKDTDTMYVDGADDAGMSGIKMGHLACLLVTGLDLPDPIISRMENTTSLMGEQEGHWGDYTVAWSYHPDNGLDISFEPSDG
jgi:hypothetical protein